MSIKTLQLKKATFAALFALLLNVAGMTNATAQTFTVGNLNYSVNSDGVSVTVTGYANNLYGPDYPNAESFENGLPSDWTTIDADGDGNNWMLSSNMTYNHPSLFGSLSMASASWDQVALFPDNYLVSNQISFTNQTIIHFYACALDNNYAAEHFGVAISTSSQTNSGDFTTIAEWTLSAKGGNQQGSPRGNRDWGNWYEYVVDLSEYAGQTGYVAIRHFNCTDMLFILVDGVYIGDNLDIPNELNIPESVNYDGNSYAVTHIGERAFYGYNPSHLNLTVTIPSTIVATDYLPFENSSITTVNYNAINCTVYGSNPLFYGCTNLTTLNIGYGVQNIPFYMFNNNGFSGTLTIPQTVTTIGYGAFAYNNFSTINYNAVNCEMYHYEYADNVFDGCNSITTLNIGSNVQTIPSYAFCNLSSLTGTLSIPNTVTTIGAYAFANTGFTGLLTLPSSLNSIGGYAFANTGFTGTLTLPDSLVSIGDGVFMNCFFDGDLIIPDLVTSIGRESFANCEGFTSLTIGTSVENIGGYNYWYLEQSQNPFYNCSGITTLNFNAASCYYVPIEWYGENGHSPFAYLSSLITLNIGESVQVIPSFAFDGCTGLTGTINIPNSVTEIGPEAFKNCSGFTGTLTIPESVTTIGGGCFEGCSGLSGALTIMPNVAFVGPRAFAYTGIETVNFNAINCEDSKGYYYLYAKPGYYQYEYREGYTFEGCENLTALVIGDGVQRVPALVFSGCSSLTGALLLPESVIEIGGSAFYGCSGFTGSLIIPDAVTYIGWDAFSDCTNLNGTLTIGQSVSEILDNAFNNTTFTTLNYNAANCNSIGRMGWEGNTSLFYNLTTVNFGDQVESLPGNAFRNCTNLTCTLTLPNSLQTIGDQAFYNCYGLEGVVMGNSVETIGSEAFRNCGGLRGTLTLPETLQTVGTYAFASCDELTTINYNAVNCTEMGNAQQPIFFDCASVEHINIGEHVLSIPNYAFKRCSTVTDMTVAATVPPTIGSSTFGTSSRSIPVTVPFGSGDDYRNATYWEEFFNIDEGYGTNPYTNHWHANTHQYAFNMSVIGVIQINGVEQVTNAWEIGAFCGNECRGSKMLAYYPQIDRYVLFLTLYGEQNDLLTFRLYNHENGEESLLVCDDVITFVPNGIMGTYQEPHVFNFLNVQNTSLSQGWNWYSSYVELGAGSLEMMTESMGTSGLLVKSQSGGFVSYDSGEWFGSLSSVNNENTYLINTSANCVMSVIGDFATPAQHPITMVNGWNWIGYPSTSTVDLNTALSRLTPHDGDMIKTQDNFSIYVEGMGWFGDFNTIYPGMGLMYNYLGSQPVTFTYSTGSSKNLGENRSTLNNHWVANRQGYPYNMSVMAVVHLDGEEQGGDEVELAAFEGDECRGSARLLYVEHLDRYIAFVTVSGAESADLMWKLYYPETGMEYENTEHHFCFEPNGIIGSLDNPYVVDFSTMTATEESFANRLAVYPNPVNANDRVTINMPCASKACVEVVNAIGAKVSVETVTGTSAFVKAPATSGVYVVKVAIDGMGTYTCKLVVE